MKNFNIENALEQTAGDRSLLIEVLKFTMEDFPEVLKDISVSFSSGNYSELSRHAHKAKGFAGACGAEKLYTASLELEYAAKDKKENCGELINTLHSVFDAFIKDPDVIKIINRTE